MLIDAEGFRQQIPIIGGLERCHPLDRLFEMNLENCQDTASHAACQVDSSRRWETEIDRLFELLSTDPRSRPAVESAQRSWKAFCQAQLAASGKMHALLSGTIWNISHADFARTLRRSQALALMTLLDPMRTARMEHSSETTP